MKENTRNEEICSFEVVAGDVKHPTGCSAVGLVNKRQGAPAD